MSRAYKDNRPGFKPVKNIELNEKHTRLRFIIVIILVAIASASFVFGIHSCVSVDPGWTRLEVSSGSAASCSEEFVFLYELGAGKTSAMAEKRALTSIYTETMSEAYEIFNSDIEFKSVNNVCSLNLHPNEVMEVNQVLYDAFSLLKSYDNRNIFLGPVYEQYDDMFYCNDDVETYDYDPYRNDYVADEYRKIAAYAVDSSQVDLILLGNGRVKLFVSEEYMEYAEENGITRFIDFFWMKNAFIVDYIADTLVSKGYTNGTLSSYDGFYRNLDSRDISYSFNIYDRVNRNIFDAAVMDYNGKRSIIYLRDYMLTQQDYWHYYEFSGGETRNSYLDIRDGKCRTALPNIVSYSDELSCAQILMEISDVYISDDFNEEKLISLGSVGIYSIYCIDHIIYFNDDTLELNNLYDNDGVRYTSFFKSSDRH